MSSALVWKPFKNYSGVLDDALKYVLEKRDGPSSVVGVYGEESLDYLRGLRDAGVKDAGKLINLIERHGEVELDLQW